MIKRIPDRRYLFGTPYRLAEVEIVEIHYEVELAHNWLYHQALYEDYERIRNADDDSPR